ncbi:uncharacterized protein LOC142355469 [Convolutriloba macropyga]|uniref:uncharacterized protein LOC142355469 n=1 Tax=Convolutriloba macropyga TaxID=536237 RepID=UPI003F51D1D4
METTESLDFFCQPNEDGSTGRELIPEEEILFSVFIYKLSLEAIQPLLLILTIAINTYCLSVVAVTDDLHSLDYLLVNAQSISDLIFNGIFGLAFYFPVHPILFSICNSYFLEDDQNSSSGALRFFGIADVIQRLYPLSRYVADMYSYSCQLFLMAGMAYERYVNIARGAEAKSVLTPRKRKYLFFAIIFVSLALPLVPVMDMVASKLWLNEEAEMPEKCLDCVIPSWVYSTVAPLIIHLVAIAVTAKLYRNTTAALKGLKKVSRKKLLTRLFALLWVSWVVTSLPYLVYRTFRLIARDVINWEMSENFVGFVDILQSQALRSELRILMMAGYYCIV